jgi:hypothetical protein
MRDAAASIAASIAGYALSPLVWTMTASPVVNESPSSVAR